MTFESAMPSTAEAFPVVTTAVPVAVAPKALTRAEIHVMGPKKKGRTGAKLRKIVPDPDDAQGFKVLGALVRLEKEVLLLPGSHPLPAARLRPSPRPLRMIALFPPLSPPDRFPQSTASTSAASCTPRRHATTTSRSGPKPSAASTRTSRSGA